MNEDIIRYLFDLRFHSASAFKSKLDRLNLVVEYLFIVLNIVALLIVLLAQLSKVGWIASFSLLFFAYLVLLPVILSSSIASVRKLFSDNKHRDELIGLDRDRERVVRGLMAWGLRDLENCSRFLGCEVESRTQLTLIFNKSRVFFAVISIPLITTMIGGGVLTINWPLFVVYVLFLFLSSLAVLPPLYSKIRLQFFKQLLDEAIRRQQDLDKTPIALGTGSECS